MQSAQLRVDSQSAAADGSTTIIPTSKIFPILGKIIRRYIIRCGRKKRQVITFSSSNYHGRKTMGKNCSGAMAVAGGRVSWAWWVLVENCTQDEIPTSSSTIITTFTIFMVSRRTSAELDVADPPENT